MVVILLLVAATWQEMRVAVGANAVVAVVAN
jgi:hypothetical protein